MHKRIFTPVAILGCLALVAVVSLAVWFLAFGGMGGGTASVGDTSVQYVSITGDDRVSLLIWSDIAGSGGSIADGGLFGSNCRGFASSADGRRIDWEWKYPKERGGDFQINGTRYNLAAGTLFLVSTKGVQVRVTQLGVDLSGLRCDRQGYEDFAKTQPKVAQFVAEASGQK